MSLKLASLLALVGAGLVDFVLLTKLVMAGWRLLDGGISVLEFLNLLLYACAVGTMAIFLYVFYKRQG